jgi:hypothetical protein
MTTVSHPTTARRLLGYASGGLNCLLALGFIVVAASSEHRSSVAAANACPTRASAEKPCPVQPATIATPAQNLRELVIAR